MFFLDAEAALFVPPEGFFAAAAALFPAAAGCFAEEAFLPEEAGFAAAGAAFFAAAGAFAEAVEAFFTAAAALPVLRAAEEAEPFFLDFASISKFANSRFLPSAALMNSYHSMHPL